MTPSSIVEIREALEARRPGLEHLAGGAGDPLDLAAALLPETDGELAVRALHAALRLDPALPQADVLAAQGPSREARLAFAVALARVGRAAGMPHVVADRLDDLRYSVYGDPGAWRDLSSFALSLGAAAELPPGGPAADLLELVGRAALDAPAPSEVEQAGELIRRLHRRARLGRWRVWLGGRPEAAPLATAADRVLESALPLAAAEATPNAEARVRLGEALDGELTVAVVADGLVLEWDGDVPPPDTVQLEGRRLDPAPHATRAAAAWWLGTPPSGPLGLVLARGETTEHLRWG